MKSTIIIIVCVITILTIVAFQRLDTQQFGGIGDIKYSVLPPDKFREENGDGWELMDDKIPLDSSTLKLKHGITELPDARGMFIRGLNLNRSDENADPFYKEKKKQRLAGEFQSDEFKEHSHTTAAYWNSNDFDAAAGEGGGKRMIYKNSGTEKSGGNETRPKNVAFYIYVKVNENK